MNPENIKVGGLYVEKESGVLWRCKRPSVWREEYFRGVVERSTFLSSECSAFAVGGRRDFAAVGSRRPRIRDLKIGDVFEWGGHGLQLVLVRDGSWIAVDDFDIPHTFKDGGTKVRIISLAAEKK